MNCPLRKLQIIIFLHIVLFSFSLKSQQTFSRNDSIAVYESGVQLLNPWAGGLNATQFSAIDFDFDGMKDLVAFDKGSFKLRCFKNTGAPGISRYKHAPGFESQFPYMEDWCLFHDYNSDGKEDIFCFFQDIGASGIRVYKNISGPAGPLQFSVAYSLLETDYNPGGTPNMLELYCSRIALPAIADIDNDGDTDILSFIVFGTTVEYHKNMAAEMGYPPDSLKFAMVDNCWGDFTENSCSASLNFCPQIMKWIQLTNSQSTSNMHAGSCMLCIDTDGDSDKDLIFGDISCDSLDYFHNAGSPANAHIDSSTRLFPSSKPVKLQYFPCSYYIDTDNDGVRDLVVSPNNSSSSQNFESVWRYKNTANDSAPVFSFEEGNFLQDSMLDFGEGAFPVLIDENGDGLTDILVGNFGYYATPVYHSRIALLRNVGTTSNPAFALITRNYAGLSTYNFQGISPAFGDMDNDGDFDMVTGHYNGQLSYFENLAGPGNPLNLSFVTSSWFGIDAFDHAMPQIIDVDRDGINDLLVGSRNGKIHYFNNTGTTAVANFSSTATSTFFGGINVCKQGFITGYAAPHLRDVMGAYELLVGSERGYLFRFGNIDGNLNGNFTLIDSVSWNVWEGGRIAPVTGDLNADGIPEMILGNYDGGINFFQGDTLINSLPALELQNDFSVFPNPATSNVSIRFTSKNTNGHLISVYDFSGKIIYTVKSDMPIVEIPLSGFSPGIYLVRSSYKTTSRACKLIITESR